MERLEGLEIAGTSRAERRQGPARRHPGWRRRERCAGDCGGRRPTARSVLTARHLLLRPARIPHPLFPIRARRPRGRPRPLTESAAEPAVVLLGADGRVVAWNQEAELAFGRRPDAAAAPSAGGPWRDGHVSPLRDGRGDLQGYAWTCGRRGRVTETDDARRRVLVVEDNHDSAESLALLLRAWGHDVRTAHDGLRAIEIAREFIPEVVLLDIGLPTVSGYEVAVWLRGMPAMDKALLVAVTATVRRRTAAAPARPALTPTWLSPPPPRR